MVMAEYLDCKFHFWIAHSLIGKSSNIALDLFCCGFFFFIRLNSITYEAGSKELLNTFQVDLILVCN